MLVVTLLHHIEAEGGKRIGISGQLSKNCTFGAFFFVSLFVFFIIHVGFNTKITDRVHLFSPQKIKGQPRSLNLILLPLSFRKITWQLFLKFSQPLFMAKALQDEPALSRISASDRGFVTVPRRQFYWGVLFFGLGIAPNWQLNCLTETSLAWWSYVHTRKM